MRGNTFGKLFSITSFGESHGQAMGVVVDGMPSQVELNQVELQSWLTRRAPGRLKGSTSRKEEDSVRILSGIFEGKTLGTPICCMVENNDQRSADYHALKDSYRPGHADKTTLDKFGVRDHRGGGRASGRETLSRVIGGYFASLVLPELKVQASILEMGPFKSQSQLSKVVELGDYGLPKAEHSDEAIEKYLLELKTKGNSIGGRVHLRVEGVPAGLGEPCFDKLKADFAKAFLSIGSCIGFQYGIGENFWKLTGQEVTANPENFGGIEGGISNGETISLELGFRPPSTVGEKAKQGRHDPCILPRVLVVVESMAYLVLADHLLRQRAYEL